MGEEVEQKTKRKEKSEYRSVKICNDEAIGSEMSSIFDRKAKNMKRIGIVVVSMAVIACICAFSFVQLQAVRSLERVGIPADMVKACIWNGISGGYLSYPSITNLKRIAAGGRATATREIATFAKSYTRTEEFKKQYLEYRDSKKPQVPEKPKTGAEQRKAQKAECSCGCGNFVPFGTILHENS